MMWERSIIKANAKTALTGRYWVGFAVCLLAGILAGLCNVGSKLDTMLTRLDQVLYTNYSYEYAGITLALSLIGMVLLYFVGNIIEIGKSRYFVHSRFGDSRFETLFSGFSDGYVNCVGASFTTSLFVGLWTLLLVVPGIIKAYQYYFVPYILADNPHLTGTRAREISRAITDGEKLNIFVMELSFFGWYLLGAITLGIGVLFVNPYYEASIAELYIFLRDRAVQAGQVNPAELCLVQGQPQPQAQIPY